MKTTELEWLKQGIKAGTIKLPDPPPEKVKGRQVNIVKELKLYGDPIDELEYLTEFSKVVNLCLYSKDIKSKFKALNLNFFHYHDNSVYEYKIAPENLILIIT